MGVEEVIIWGPDEGPVPVGSVMRVPSGTMSIRLFCQGGYDAALSDQHADSSWGTYISDGTTDTSGTRVFRWVAAAGWCAG